MRAGLSIILAAMLAGIMPAVAGAPAIQITSDPTSNMSCTAGVCTSTAANAVLNVNDLEDMLASSDVSLRTAAGAQNIEIQVPLSWASSSRLTLDANYNVAVKAAVTVAGTAGLTIVTNDGSTGGDLIFTPTGSVSFWDTTSSLIINGTSYTLVNDLTSLKKAVREDPRGAFALAQNYDASRDPYGRIPVDTELAGTFEGLGNTITNFHLYLRRNSASCAGLFSAGASTSIFRDIRLSNVSVDSRIDLSGPGVGGLVGCTSGTIINASVQGGVGCRCQGSRDVGLLAGDAGTIIRSEARGNVGQNSERRRGITRFGGLVGYATNIVSSYADVDVLAAVNPVAGGLAGEATTIQQSYATGTIRSYGTQDEMLAGGLVGRLSGDGAQMTNSYALESITFSAKSYTIGGLVGVGSNIQDSYVSDNICLYKNSQCVSISGNKQIGGFIGEDTGPGSLANDYWDLDTSGGISSSQGAGNISNDAGIYTISDQQLKKKVPPGFDRSIWTRKTDINNGYPFLRAVKPN
ncbi:MAG TPA: hypothetical protein VGM17_08560 [Rhizomicrobium sp.]|jgi:hypothetical protein